MRDYFAATVDGAVQPSLDLGDFHKALLAKGRLALPESYIQRMSYTLGLSEERVLKLLSLPYGFVVESICSASRKNPDNIQRRIEAMGTYGEDPLVDVDYTDDQDDSWTPTVFGNDKGSLAADGIVMKQSVRVPGKLSKDIGYALLYQASRELDEKGDPSKDIIRYFRAGAERVQWKALGEYIATVTREVEPLSPSEIFHLYDYAVFRESDRRKGIGRLTLRIASDHVLGQADSERAIRLGFIDPEHADSLVASPKAGSILGKEVPTSHDGPHPSILSFYGPNLERSFTGNVLMSSEQVRDDLSSYVQRLRDRLSEGKLIAFNPKSDAFEIVELRFRH